jgi:hypothetical protein
MKKLVFVAGLLLVSLGALKAQEIFQKGDNVINAGIGLGSVIPIELSLDHGIIDGLIKGENGSIGVGGYLSYYRDGVSDWGHWTYMTFGVRGTFHYQFIPKLDTYGGLMIGYSYAKWTWDVDDYGNYSYGSSSPLGYSLFVGGRYYFKSNLAVFAELGYGIANLSAGISFKF